MVDRYSIPWCYGVCGCTGSPFLKQLKVLLGSDEALKEEGSRGDPRSTVLSRQVDPSPTEWSAATANLSSPSPDLSFSLGLSLFPHFFLPQFLKFLRSGLGICFVFPVGWGTMSLPSRFFFFRGGGSGSSPFPFEMERLQFMVGISSKIIHAKKLDMSFKMLTPHLTRVQLT